MFLKIDIFLLLIFLCAILNSVWCFNIQNVNNINNSGSAAAAAAATGSTANDSDNEDIENYNNINNSNNDNNTQSIIENLSWDCANNASCVNQIATNFIQNYHAGSSLNFGLFSFKKLPNEASASSTSRDLNFNNLMSFLSGNLIRIPIGPMVFTVGRSLEHEDYLEVAILKKSLQPTNGEGRRRGRPNLREKKQLQMLIPMYLAATTFGWTLFAIKAVAALTIKAFIVSKLAFLVTAGIIMKKLMDTASEKMLMQHHQPYIMPYHMDYGIHGHSMAGAEMSPSEFYNVHLANHHPGAVGLENMAAESSLAHAIEIQANATQPQILAALAAAAGGNGSQKIKRNDQWTGVKTTNPNLYGYIPSANQQPHQPVFIYHK